MSGVSADRRRLTVSACDAVGARKGRPDDLETLLQEAGVDLFASLEAGKRGVLLAAKTDSDMQRRKSFAEKDHETIVPPGQDPDENYLWLTTTLGIGFACRKGLKPESPNQDSFFVLAIEGQYILFCVLDGHGPHGHDISNIARSLLLKNFLTKDFRKDVEQVFGECFVATQIDIETQKQYDCASSGTTCSMAFYDYSADSLTIAHVGDSRAVLGMVDGRLNLQSVDDLTIDHKPDLAQERKRIESADPPGRVEFDGYYNHRVFAMGKTYPGLNMSRALGDAIAHKEAGLTAVPDVKTVDLKTLRDKCEKLILLVCTDGVWEFMKQSSDAVHEVVGNLKESGDPDRPKGLVSAGALASESYKRWMADSDGEISDDITVVWTML